MRQVSPEVYYASDEPVVVGSSTIAGLAGGVAQTGRRRVRLCAHEDVSDRLHEMFIVVSRDSYIRPHRHLNKAESLHVIEGEADAVFFDETGAITGVLRLAPYGAGDAFYYRLATPVFHTLVLRSDTFVFHEATTGPFVAADSEFASWAPDEGQIGAVSAYRRALEEQVASFVDARSPDARRPK